MGTFFFFDSPMSVRSSSNGPLRRTASLVSCLGMTGRYFELAIPFSFITFEWNNLPFSTLPG